MTEEKIPLVDYITQYFEGGVERPGSGLSIYQVPNHTIWHITDDIHVVGQKDKSRHCRCGYPAPWMFVRKADGTVLRISFCVGCPDRYAVPVSEPRYYRIERKWTGDKLSFTETKIYEDEEANNPQASR